MRKKYAYYVNNERFSRKDFIEELKECCTKIVSINVVSDELTITEWALDQKTFNKKMKQIDNGSIFVAYNWGIFRRKEV